MDAVLETRSLCKSFGALTVAQSIDFRLRPGDRHALIGPNGAGKTTFVNMLMGALRPSSGRILLGGDDVTRAPQAQRRSEERRVGKGGGTRGGTERGRKADGEAWGR